MALQLGTVITAARDKHGAFHRTRVTDAVLARELTGYQRRIISRAADLDSNFVAQQCSIVFANNPANAPSAVGAGSQGGLPADDAKPNQPAINYKDTGPAVALDVETAPVLVSDTAITSADTISVTLAAPSPPWSVNQFANKWLAIVLGTGAGQIRQILSNTTTRLIISTGTDLQQFAIVPDATSIIRVVAATPVADRGMDVLTELMPTDTRSGFLVRLNAAGQPFLDPTRPLVATFDRGIPLPPYERVIGGTVRFGSGALLDNLTIRPYRLRYQWGPSYTVWLESGQMFLCGTRSDWQEIASIDLRYVPNAPAFAALTDYFLLDEDFYDPAVWRAAYIAGQRINGMPDMPKVDVTMFREELRTAEASFLGSVGAHGRAFPVYIKDAW